MESDKRKMHPFFKILIVLFLVFIAFYISLESGYYPSRVKKRTMITNGEISGFEESIRQGKEISASGYLEEEKDYSNFATKAANGLTYAVGKLIEEGIKGVNEVVKVLFW